MSRSCFLSMSEVALCICVPGRRSSSSQSWSTLSTSTRPLHAETRGQTSEILKAFFSLLFSGLPYSIRSSKQITSAWPQSDTVSILFLINLAHWQSLLNNKACPFFKEATFSYLLDAVTWGSPRTWTSVLHGSFNSGELGEHLARVSTHKGPRRLFKNVQKTSTYLENDTSNCELGLCRPKVGLWICRKKCQAHCRDLLQIGWYLRWNTLEFFCVYHQIYKFWMYWCKAGDFFFFFTATRVRPIFFSIFFFHVSTLLL